MLTFIIWISIGFVSAIIIFYLQSLFNSKCKMTKYIFIVSIFFSFLGVINLLILIRVIHNILNGKFDNEL